MQNISNIILQNLKNHNLQYFNDYLTMQTYEMPFSIQKIAPLRTSTYFRSGNWTPYQKLKFAIFTEFNKNIFLANKGRRSMKIFKYMSQFIKTKSSKQCRSHHQKICKKHKNILMFVDLTKKIYGNYRYQVSKLLFSQQLQGLKHQMNKHYDVQHFQQNQVKIQDIVNLQKQQPNLIPTNETYNLYPPQNNTQYQTNLLMLNTQQFNNINNQRAQLVQQCNYYWFNWVNSTLKLESIAQSIQSKNKKQNCEQ